MQCEIVGVNPYAILCRPFGACTLSARWFAHRLHALLHCNLSFVRAGPYSDLHFNNRLCLRHKIKPYATIAVEKLHTSGVLHERPHGDAAQASPCRGACLHGADSRRQPLSGNMRGRHCQPCAHVILSRPHQGIVGCGAYGEIVHLAMDQ